MKPRYKFAVAVAFTCGLCGECSGVGVKSSNYEVGAAKTLVAIFTVLSVLNTGSNALPPSSLFQKRLGSPMPEIGSPTGSLEDEDSEEEEDLLESSPRVEPQITPMNRDQCLAKLLCGMSVPVTGGSSKKNYYNEYANIVSRFFEAFPLDEELQSKESIETYDDYSNEDDGKPSRFNSKRKPMNSSRVEATQPTLQLFDLALVDVAKPEDLKNRTRKQLMEKVARLNSKFRNVHSLNIPTHRVARARKIVEHLGQKLQTVRQCQSIAGCPFTFKQLREKLKKKEAQRISSNVPLPPLPGPIFSSGLKRDKQPSPSSFFAKPYVNKENRPKPIPPTQAEAISEELFSNERPAYPNKDNNKGDDELEEIFGPPKISKRPLGFHQGVDEQYNYEYNPDKPWRPGTSGESSYGYNPWKNRPRPPPRPFGTYGSAADGHHRPAPRPRPNNSGPSRPNSNSNQNFRPKPSQKRNPPPKPQSNSKEPIMKRKPIVQQDSPKVARPTVSPTSKSPFPKKKISYLNSPYKKPNSNEDDDEGAEDINKVAPVELIVNSDAGESEPTRKTTTQKPETKPTMEPAFTKKNKKKDNDDDSEEYEDDDYYEDDYEEEDLDDDYSDEDDKKSKKKKKVYSKKKNIKKKEESEEEEEEEEEDEKEATTKAPIASSTTTSLKPRIKVKTNQNFDDETDDVDAIWMKLNFATTGGQYQAKDKKKEEESKIESQETEAQGNKGASGEELDDDDDDDDDEDEDEDEEDEEEEAKTVNDSAAPASVPEKVRTSSVSGSVEDDADDELDEENNSKAGRRKKAKKKQKGKSGDADTLADDLPAPTETVKDKKATEGGKKSKKAKKPSKKGSSEEDVAKKTPIMLEIGGRPLVPKPEVDQNSNAQKTSSLMSNRFKFQFINPYGAAPPSPHHQPIDGPPPPSAFGPPMHAPPSHSNNFSPTPSSVHSSGGLGGSASSLPFKFKLNPGALGSLSSGPGKISLGGLPGFGSGSGSIEDMPDPHHPPPPTPFMPHSQLRQDQMSSHHQQGFSTGASGMGGSSLSSASNLFKINPISSLKNFFKRPSSSFDPMNHDGQNPPPMNAFIHRPVGPESSQYRRGEGPPSPASGSSSPSKKAKKGSKSGKGKAKKGKL